MIPASELQALRDAAAKDALPETATVFSWGLTDSTDGGRVEGLNAEGVPMPVRIGTKPAAEPVNMAGRLESITDIIHISYPDGRTLNVNDQLLMADGRRFQVSVLLTGNSWSMLNECQAIRIT